MDPLFSFTTAPSLLSASSRNDARTHARTHARDSSRWKMPLCNSVLQNGRGKRCRGKDYRIFLRLLSDCSSSARPTSRSGPSLRTTTRL